MRNYKSIKRIVVVGGGTAGWITVNYLSSLEPLFRKQFGDDFSITLIESSKLGRIGVGESTTHRFKHFITGGHGYNFPHLNLEDFILESKATYKMGVKLIGWNTGDVSTETEDFYWNPFDSVGFQPVNFPEFFDGLRTRAVADRQPTSFNLHQQLMEKNAGPYILIPDDYHNSTAPTDGYGFHFDAHLAAEYVKTRTIEATNINYIDGEVTDVEVTDGQITSVVVDGEDVAGDLFFDCTGFKRLLMTAVGNTEWHSYKNELPLDKAIMFPMERNPGEDIPSYTVGRALSSGWVFEIPTQERYGRGYIYSSQHQTQEDAIAELKDVYGDKYREPKAFIDIESGRLDKFWYKNVVAVGLSSGFAEPLEATAIDATIQQISKFVHGYLLHEMVVDHNTPLHKDYNNLMGDLWDDIRDWLSLHYISERRDSPFWEYMSKPERFTHVQDQLDLWSYRMPRKDEHGFQGVALTYHVLQGLGILDDSVAQREIDFYDLERETRYQHIVIKDDLKYRLQYSASNLDTLQRITRNKEL